MRTRLGEVEVWDGHAHFFSHKFFEVLVGQSPLLAGAEDKMGRAGELTGFEIPPADPVELGAEWVEQMQKYEVAGMLLIASVPGDESSIAAALKRWPDRIAGGFFFDPTQPDVEARARRAFDELELSVACLFPAMHRYSVAECEGVRVVASLAEERGKAVFVHCGVLSIGVRKLLGLQSRFDLRYCNPLDLHVVAREFERARFIIPHFGAGMFREALMVVDHCPNVYLDTSGSNGWMKYEPALDLASVFRRAVQVAGWERLIFGTDSSFFPRGWQYSVFEAQLQALENIGATLEQAKAVLGGNLKKLLGQRK